MPDATPQKAAVDNRAAQLDPQNECYYLSRGMSAEEAAARAAAVRKRNLAENGSAGPARDSAVRSGRTGS